MYISLYFFGSYFIIPASENKKSFLFGRILFFRPGKIELIFYLAEIEKNKIIQFGQIKKKI